MKHPQDNAEIGNNSARRPKMLIDMPILLLCCSAMLLLGAVLFWNPAPARADLVTNNRDYNVVTGSLQQGGEGLYVTDINSGRMAIFVYDSKVHSLQLRQVISVSDLFR